MTTTVEPRQTLTAMIHRHEAERRDLADALLAEQREQGDRLLAAVNPEVGAALAGAVADVERQIRQDRKADRLLAKIEPVVPGWAQVAFPPLDSDEVNEGRKRMVVFVPPRFGGDHQEPVAVALVDVSDAVFGTGASARRDRAAEDQQQAQDSRDREIEAQRQRAALRR